MSSTTVTEPEWDQESRELVTALARLEADECVDCGQPRSESWSERAHFNYRGDDRIRYIAEAHRCYACEALEVEKKNWSDDPSFARKFHVTKQ